MGQEGVGIVAEFRVRVTIAICLAVIVGALCCLFVTLPNYRDELRFLTATLGGGAVLYAGYYAGAACKVNIARDRQRSSFEILQCLNDVDMVRIRNFIEQELNGKDLTAQQVYDRIVSDAELLSRVQLLLGLFEDTSIAVQQRYVDELMLYSSLVFLVPWVFYNLQAYIKEERGRHGNCIYSELEKLAEAWKGFKSLATGEPFPSADVRL